MSQPFSCCRACGSNRAEIALSGEFIVEEKIARCKPGTDGGYLKGSAMHVKTAFSRMRKRRGRNSCIWLETFRVFRRVRMRSIPRRVSGLTRSGKSREKILDPWCSASAGVQACNACRDGYINFETFRASGSGPGRTGIAGTLDTPGFRSRWPALCVSVGTAVDEVTTGRFQKKTDGTRFGFTSGKEGRSASGNTQLQVD